MSDPENPYFVAQEQREDSELWLEPETEHEAILQRALRRMHASIEGECWPPEDEAAAAERRR